MNNKYYLIIVLLTLAACINSQSLEQYYASAEGKTGSELKSALHSIIKNNHVFLSYSGARDALKITDEDPNNSNNVLLLYTGWSYPKSNFGGSATQWNREHTWAKSMGNFGTSTGPGTDIHHLRPTDVTVNSKRGNLYFDNGGSEYVDNSRYNGGSEATGCKYDGDSWEPRDEVKGDVARMLFYMAVRYEAGDKVDLELDEYSSSSGKHGKLSTLLEWHKQDPVNQWELDRNERIYNIQGNRNPFINHPEYVDAIWGDGNTGGGDDDDEYTNLFFEDFESQTLGKMSAYDIIGNSKEWYNDDHLGNHFAKMSGFTNPGYIKNEDWLINTNAVDLNGFNDLSFSFISMMRIYGGSTTLKVFISDNYDGTSNPNNFNWTEVTSQASFSSGDYNIVSSGDIDLTPWQNSSIYVGFKFENSASGSSTWQIDDIKIKGKKITASVTNSKYDKLVIYPNPASSHISFNLDVKVKEANIYDQAGNIVQNISAISSNSPIELNNLSKGIYVLKIIDIEGNSAVKKLMIK